MRRFGIAVAGALALFSSIMGTASAQQEPGPPGTAPGGDVSVQQITQFVDPMTQVDAINVRGGVVTQGSPIAGDFDGADNVQGNADDGTSTNITLDVPGTSVVMAKLYWTVLTNSDEASNQGQSIEFDGEPVDGSLVGFAEGRTPCFPQANTFAWTADVTDLVTTGLATHTVAGLPGGNQINGADFAEGASLLVVFRDPTETAREVVLYEGLAVTREFGDTVDQTLTGFDANALGAVEAEWFPVIGNGQVSPEDLTFTGSLGSLDLGNDALLDGSTSEFPQGTASYTDSGLTQVFWDDDHPDVSSVIANDDTSASFEYELTGDCHTFVASWLQVTKESEVEIDIKPHSDPNAINTRSRGVIPVAILSTEDFDATDVDPASVCFGDADDPELNGDCTEAHGKGHIQDVDGDGDDDLVLHFETQETGIEPGDTEACLTGHTFGGDEFIIGCDAIVTVPA